MPRVLARQAAQQPRPGQLSARAAHDLVALCAYAGQDGRRDADELTAASLRDWITGSQHLKPGNQMPDMRLPADRVEALVAYLKRLR